MTTQNISHQISVLEADIETLQRHIDEANTFDERRELRAQTRELRAQIRELRDGGGSSSRPPLHRSTSAAATLQSRRSVGLSSASPIKRGTSSVSSSPFKGISNTLQENVHGYSDDRLSGYSSRSSIFDRLDDDDSDLDYDDDYFLMTPATIPESIEADNPFNEGKLEDLVDYVDTHLTPNQSPAKPNTSQNLSKVTGTVEPMKDKATDRNGTYDSELKKDSTIEDGSRETGVKSNVTSMENKGENGTDGSQSRIIVSNKDEEAYGKLADNIGNDNGENVSDLDQKEENKATIDDIQGDDDNNNVNMVEIEKKVPSVQSPEIALECVSEELKCDDKEVESKDVIPPTGESVSGSEALSDVADVSCPTFSDCPTPVEDEQLLVVTSEDGTINVFDDVQMPTFSIKLSDQTVTDGQRVTFVCNVSGKPTPTITWYKNNSLIHPRPEFKQTYGDGVATLELRDIFPEDAGKFVCVAKNEAGEAKSTCTVRVKDRPQNTPSWKKSTSPGFNSPSSKFGTSFAGIGGSKSYNSGQRGVSRWSTSPQKTFGSPVKHFNSPISPSKMATADAKKKDISEMDDEEELHKMMNNTDNFEERKKIRGRLKEIREAKSAAWESQRAASQTGRESAVAMRQRQAEEKRAAEKLILEKQAKEKRESTALGAREEGIRKRQAEAVQNRDRKLEECKEMSAVMSQAYNVDSKDVLNAANKRNTAAEEATLTSTKSETGPDGSKVTTHISTTTNKTKDGSTTTTKQTRQVTKTGGFGGTNYNITKTNAAKPGAKAAFQKLDDDTSSKPNFLAPSSSSPDTGSPTSGGSSGRVQRSPTAIKEMLLNWCKKQTEGYPNVEIKNFSSSWNDGMAFCALIHHFYPKTFDFNRLDPKKRRGNFRIAFDVAEKFGGIAPLLEVDDMVRMKNPDWKCVFTYVQSFYRQFRNHDSNGSTPTTPSGPKVLSPTAQALKDAEEG